MECGSTTLSEFEIVDFAEQFDPLDIHAGPEAGSRGQFGGIIASGYRTLCLSVRLLVEAVRSVRAVGGGPGIDDVTWHRPVEPGDALSVRSEILDARHLSSNPDADVVREEVTVTNQAEETALSYENDELVRRRERETAADD